MRALQWPPSAIAPLGRRDEEAVQRGDVGMVERGERAGFALEPSDALLVARHLLGQDLDRHLAPEPGVAGAVHLSHASRAEGGEHLVLPQARAWL
jgi:hypothetical protein